MIGNDHLFPIGNDLALLLITGDNRFDSFFQVLLHDRLTSVLDRQQSRLIDDIGQFRTAGTGTGTGDRVKVDRRRAFHILGMYLQNRFPSGQIRQFDRNASVKTARSNSAGSRLSGRFVAARMTTPLLPSKPSISASS